MAAVAAAVAILTAVAADVHSVAVAGVRSAEADDRSARDVHSAAAAPLSADARSTVVSSGAFRTQAASCTKPQITTFVRLASGAAIDFFDAGIAGPVW